MQYGWVYIVCIGEIIKLVLEIDISPDNIHGAGSYYSILKPEFLFNLYDTLYSPVSPVSHEGSDDSLYD